MNSPAVHPHKSRSASPVAEAGSPRRVWIFAGLLTVVLAVVTVLRHVYFLTSTYDMGFYVHNVWAIAHGDWTSSVFGFHVLADHFSPIMILLAPVAYLNTAVGLLVVQAVAVGTAVIPAFRLGTRLGGDRLGWLCALWLGLSASVWHTVMYDFRPATLGFVALVWLIAELEGDRRMWLVYLLVGLAAAAREDVALFAGLAVLMQAYFGKERRLILPGSLAIATGVWYTALGQRLFAPFDYFLWYRYADYGDGPLEALGNLAYTVPTGLERLVRPEVLVAFGALLIPFLVIPPLRGWRRTWPAFLIMLGNGVSAAPYIPTIYYQYYILAVAFLLWGSAHAAAEGAWLDRARVITLVTVGVFLLAGPLITYESTPFGRSIAGVTAMGPRAVLAEEIDDLPADASVSAGNSLLPHLAERPEIFAYPVPMVCGELIQRYTPATHYPDLVVIRPEEQDDVDLAALGYEAVDTDGRVAVWESTGRPPPSQSCPPPEALKAATFERVRQEAESG